MLRFVFDNNEIRLLDDSRLEPRTRNEITKIFRKNHDSKLSGHFNKTYSKIKERYYWDTMKKDIRAYVKGLLHVRLIRQTLDHLPSSQWRLLPQQIDYSKDWL